MPFEKLLLCRCFALARLYSLDKKHILNLLKRDNGQRHTRHCWLEFKRPIETCAPSMNRLNGVMAAMWPAINNEIVSVNAMFAHYKLCTMHSTRSMSRHCLHARKHQTMPRCTTKLASVVVFTLCSVSQRSRTRLYSWIFLIWKYFCRICNVLNHAIVSCTAWIYSRLWHILIEHWTDTCIAMRQAAQRLRFSRKMSSRITHSLSMIIHDRRNCDAICFKKENCEWGFPRWKHISKSMQIFCWFLLPILCRRIPLPHQSSLQDDQSRCTDKYNATIAQYFILSSQTVARSLHTTLWCRNIQTAHVCIFWIATQMISM